MPTHIDSSKTPVQAQGEAIRLERCTETEDNTPKYDYVYVPSLRTWRTANDVASAKATILCDENMDRVKTATLTQWSRCEREPGFKRIVETTTSSRVILRCIDLIAVSNGRNVVFVNHTRAAQKDIEEEFKQGWSGYLFGRSNGVKITPREANEYTHLIHKVYTNDPLDVDRLMVAHRLANGKIVLVITHIFP